MSLKLNTVTGKDYLTLDYEGFRQMMIERLKERLPEYTDFSETDMGIVLIELTAYGLDIISYYKDRQALECFLPTARERKNVIMHCKTYFGYTLAGATPAIFVQVFETDRSGFSKKAGDLFKVHTKEKQGESAIYYELIGSLDVNDGFNPNFYIPEGKTGDEMHIAKHDNDGNPVYEYDYRALVCQGVTVSKEYVGVSDGTAYQKYFTSQSPVLDYDSSASGRYGEEVVRVFVGESSEEWTRVDSFLLSKPDSKHFVFTVDDSGNGVIEFGNDLSGKIPPDKSKIKCTYRAGGGERTNVGVNTITEYDTAESGLIRTFNPYTALVLGTDAESIEEAKVKAPASLRALDRAVTIRDYADIGVQLDYVSSAQSVLVNSDSFTDRNDKGIDGSGYEDIIAGNAPYDYSTEGGISESNVGYVLTWLMTKNPKIDPDSYNYDDPKNIPRILISDDTLSFLRNDYYLNRKMIGQKFKVFPADIEWVVPHLRITVDDNYIKSSVIQDVKSKLIELMALGKYQLEQPVVWSDVVSELVSSSSGVTGIKSAIFFDTVTVENGGNIQTIRTIADDKPSHVGRVYALKHSKEYTKEKPDYEFDIYAEGGLTGE